MTHEARLSGESTAEFWGGVDQTNERGGGGWLHLVMYRTHPLLSGKNRSLHVDEIEHADILSQKSKDNHLLSKRFFTPVCIIRDATKTDKMVHLERLKFESYNQKIPWKMLKYIWIFMLNFSCISSFILAMTNLWYLWKTGNEVMKSLL